MKNQFNYPASITKQKEGGYLVRFPDFPEAITQGKNIDDAVNEAIDCLEEAIANRIEMKLDIPAPKPFKKRHHCIPVHAILQPRLPYMKPCAKSNTPTPYLPKN